MKPRVPVPLLPFFVVATMVWLGVALLLGANAAPPDGCSWAFPCLAANELGDYLSGVFAPIAFLWLIAAVVLQSRELAAQREVLELTQEEMVEQRKVSQLQMEETRKQAELISKQTEVILSEQQDIEVRALIQALHLWVKVNCSERFVGTKTINGRVETYHGERGYLTERTPDDSMEFFFVLCSRLLHPFVSQRRPSPDANKVLTMPRHQLHFIFLRINEIWKRAANASPRMRATIAHSDALQVISQLPQEVEFETDVAAALLKSGPVDVPLPSEPRSKSPANE